jgi:hypothetical protein
MFLSCSSILSYHQQSYVLNLFPCFSTSYESSKHLNLVFCTDIDRTISFILVSYPPFLTFS